MLTDTLYYQDCHLKTFTATVRSCEAAKGGYAVIVNNTAFYPEGGGQACDLGTLGDARVLDVQEQAEAIIHLCDRPLAVGSAVTGTIDWARRFDLMQQHSGEHIISGLVFSRYGHHNVGFHVGAEAMEIDFDGPIPMEELLQLELAANEAVQQNLPIRCWYPSREELAGVFYRTKKQLPWPVRIVEVPGFDACACCGVHVASTGEIGLIKILSCVKFHQGVRIQLVCGQRAVKLVQQVFEQNRQVSQAFSAKMLETAAAAAKMNDALAAEKLRANTLQSAMFAHIAAGYTGKGNTIYTCQGLEPGQVRELADKIYACCGGWAAVLSQGDGVCSICILGTPEAVKPLSEQLKTKLNARGGGKPGSFQGTVAATKEEIEACLLGTLV